MDTFDPMSEAHVRWLKSVILADGVKKKTDCVKNNPFGWKSDAGDLPQLLFVLSAKYTKALFENRAFIISN